MDYGPASIPFPTRMTVARLDDGRLWLHSPIAPDAALFDAVDALGEVAWLVAPNSLHYWYVADWQHRYPGARTLAVPGLAAKAKRAFRIDATVGEDETALPGGIAAVLVPGTAVTEAVFHHRASRAVILTDLIENFEPARIRSRLLRWPVRLSGAAPPHGQAPIDLPLTFPPPPPPLRAAVAEIRASAVGRVRMAPPQERARSGQGWTVRVN